MIEYLYMSTSLLNPINYIFLKWQKTNNVEEKVASISRDVSSDRTDI